MEENQKSNRAFNLYEKSIKKTEPFNPYEIRPLSDFKNIVDYMRTTNKKKTNNINIYEFVYDRTICRDNFKTSNTDYPRLEIFYINFFLNNIPMTIVYAVKWNFVQINYAKKPKKYESRVNDIQILSVFKPIAYSKNAVDENGNPFTIDFLIENAGLKQIVSFKNKNKLYGHDINPLFKNSLQDKYELAYFQPDRSAPNGLNQSELTGLDLRSEIFIIPNYCLGNLMYSKPNIGPLISDFKNTVEEMKGAPITTPYIPWAGEYYREGEKQWDEHLAESSNNNNKRSTDELEQNEDFKRTRKSGGKNKKKTKRRKNKRRQTRKRN